eukprot:1158380-Pelagomonas_calceolata.AAC.2
MGCCFSSSQKSAVPSGGRSTGYREQPAPQAVAQTQRREQNLDLDFLTFKPAVCETLFVMGCCFGKESSGYQSWGSGRAGGAAVQTQQDAEARAIAAERVGEGPGQGTSHVSLLKTWCSCMFCLSGLPQLLLKLYGMKMVQAAQRQQQFENSAVGRAAYTAVKDVKNPKSTPMHGSRGGGGVDARDWMS